METFLDALACVIKHPHASLTRIQQKIKDHCGVCGW